ncbi:MAG: DUF763 domain-containing protein [Thermodesulfobacteriaceae bacterium]|nr:DUF763 domain-containing protein [Thermodesulfobacteriaceae bacterium]MCX8041205.1 DUF763 domain-containing protein [Thermodesulfobacteriaceae bacterium]MDW8136349.1 DUF763 domain-containing protein [Thermodesulfobacterium sp.]
MIKKDIVDLPLHGGKCPSWLFEKMVRLSRAILLLVYMEFGREELLRRISDPFWFQALGCLLGFDWHSSGLTTTVGGALKEALSPYFKEIGIYLCGGKGKRALQTPQEIEFWGEKHALPLETQYLITLSRLTARIDNHALQDGFKLYFHLFIFSKEGSWAVVQQGMDETTAYARRYHWYSKNTVDLCEEPHTGILSPIKRKEVLNLVAKESKAVQNSLVALIRENPAKILKEVSLQNYLIFKKDHELSLRDLTYKNLKKVLEITYENPPSEFKELLLTSGLGAKTLRALTLTAELIYNVRASREDPVCYAYAHGGKDGHPYRLNRKLYETTLRELEEIISKVKISHSEKLELFRKLPYIF